MKELYYKRTDADKAAQAFAAELSQPTTKFIPVDDRCRFDYKDREALNCDWSGETNAYFVTGYDKDGNLLDGIFAYLSWED